MKGIKKRNPFNPSSRAVKRVNRSGLWSGKPLRELCESKKSTGGRNNYGRITCQHRGGGAKHKYRIIDFLRNKAGKAIVERLEYDPNRTAFIALIKYEDGEYSYIIAPDGLGVGMHVESGDSADNSIGNCKKLENIPIGTIVHNIETIKGRGGRIVRSAGTGAPLVGKETGNAILKLPSGKTYYVSLDCRASIGLVSNVDHINESLGNAGTRRHMGFRPAVRGIAKNPVDHPHGGRTDGGQRMSPSGIRMGTKTRPKRRGDRKRKNKQRGR